MANTPIQNPSGWISILNRLGITGIARWFLSDTVTPVALVDSSVTLNASLSTPLVNVPASAGETVAPVANTRLANTGPLPGGPYSMVFWIDSPEAQSFRLRRRNSADAGDVWGQLIHTPANTMVVVALRLFLANNERVVVENVAGGTAGLVYQASIFINAG